jgi:hypothetical protein
MKRIFFIIFLLPAIAFGQKKADLSITDIEALYFMPNVETAQTFLQTKGFKLKEILQTDRYYIYEQKTKLGSSVVTLTKYSQGTNFSDISFKSTDSLTVKQFDKSILLTGYNAIKPIDNTIDQNRWFEKTIQVIGTKLRFLINGTAKKNNSQISYVLQVEAK